MDLSEELKTFSVKLHEIDAVKFGDFKTKIGLMTPVYCDLRVIISYPKILAELSKLMVNFMPSLKTCNVICGVPYTALPIATAISLDTGVPMVMRRKEAKSYGTKKMIEGTYKPGDKCIIIEDVVTSGSSVLETVADLTKEGILVTDAIVLLNREQGAEAVLKKSGIKLHALLTLTQLMNHLKGAGKVENATCDKVADYLVKNQVDNASLPQEITLDRLKMSFKDRIPYAKNNVSAHLLRIMSERRTNLCLSADLTDGTDLLNLADELGPYICLLKIHCDIVDDFHINLAKALRSVAAKYNFLLFEDRKFADIGQTVASQYSGGLYKISSWASVVTAHSIMGPGLLDAIAQSKGVEERGVFLLAEGSSDGSLADDHYRAETIKMAAQYPQLVTGMVCQSVQFRNDPGLLQLTPGVRLPPEGAAVAGDDLGQRYNTPAHVILERGADIAVVGRGIIHSPEPLEAVKLYKKLLWDAYLQRIQ